MKMITEREGYIIEQLLISLSVCAFLIPVASVVLLTLMRTVQMPFRSQDESGITQLRHVIAVSDDFVCGQNELSFHHRGKDQILRLSSDNLVLSSPGTQIFLTDLSEISFSMEGGLIYLVYAHPDEESRKVCIGHA